MLSSNRYSKPWGHWFECQWLQKWDNSACIFFWKHVEKWAFNWSLCLADGTRGLIQGKIPLLQLVMGQWVSVARSEVRGRGAGLKNYRRTLCSLRQSKLHTDPLTWVTSNSESRYARTAVTSFVFHLPFLTVNTLRTAGEQHNTCIEGPMTPNSQGSMIYPCSPLLLLHWFITEF